MIVPERTGLSGGWSSGMLAMAMAYYSTCPVLVNLAATYIVDGNSFLFVVAISCGMLALVILAGVRLGFPKHATVNLRGPALFLTVIAGIFWVHWICVNLISPTPVEEMRNQVVQSLTWTVIPIVCFLCWRESISMTSVIRFMILLCAIYIVGLTVRWTLHLGHYQSGRWHAGQSLEAVRSGRYASLAFWIFTVSCLCPVSIVPGRFKIISLICLPLTVLMMIATNSRGPWLGLAVALIVTAIPIGRIAYRLIQRDIRLLFLLAITVIAVAGLLAWKLSDVESDNARLFTLRHDGGSAAERYVLWNDHSRLMSQTPATIISGNGYDHGLFYPHNIFLESIVDGGFVCLALLTCMVGLGMYVYFGRSTRQDVPTLLFFGIFLNSLIGSQVASSIANDATWLGTLLLVCRYDELKRLTQPDETTCLESR